MPDARPIQPVERMAHRKPAMVNPMNSAMTFTVSRRLNRPPGPRAAGLGATLGALALLGVLSLSAENTNSMLKPHHTWHGGFDPRPELTAAKKDTNAVGNLLVKWVGVQGPFQVQKGSSVAPDHWLNVGGPTYEQSATLPIDGEVGIVRVQGGSPNYIGSYICQACHHATYTNYIHTAHFGALQTLKNIGMDKNAGCLPCHTVGYGLPNGYVDMQTTPHLAGVQCENCHGPAGNHVADITDVSVRPKVTLAAEVCGGCHADVHHPTYENWRDSKHAEVTPDVASGFISTGESRMLACGPCHSGAVRDALLEQLEKPSTPLPSREDAAAIAVTCAVCHDAHVDALDSQLRNPKYSLANFSYNTATNTSFAAQYNPDIQVCGQCHNMRGATWKDTSRPPHHSPQYNILIGQGGFDLGQPQIASHGLDIDRQCVQCHTFATSVDNPTDTEPNYTGHTFKVSFDGCVDCHGLAIGSEALMHATQQGVVKRITEVKGLLDRWATNKAPAALQVKYGPLAWEYTNVGQLSNPTADPKIVGPTTAEQASVPDAIKQARMNLYLIEHDASKGVHNGRYARYLLGVAKTNVLTELSKP